MHVYVIEAPHGCKIGVSVKPSDRLRTLETQGGFAASRFWVSVPTELALKVEKSSHAYLADHRTHGEWFSVDFETAVNTVCSAINDRVGDGAPVDPDTSPEKDKWNYGPEDYEKWMRNFFDQVVEMYPHWLPGNCDPSQIYRAKAHQALHRRLDVLEDDEIERVAKFIDQLDEEKRALYELLRSRFENES